MSLNVTACVVDKIDIDLAFCYWYLNRISAASLLRRVIIYRSRLSIYTCCFHADILVVIGFICLSLGYYHLRLRPYVKHNSHLVFERLTHIVSI